MIFNQREVILAKFGLSRIPLNNNCLSRLFEVSAVAAQIEDKPEKIFGKPVWNFNENRKPIRSDPIRSGPIQILSTSHCSHHSSHIILGNFRNHSRSFWVILGQFRSFLVLVTNFLLNISTDYSKIKIKVISLWDRKVKQFNRLRCVKTRLIKKRSDLVFNVIGWEDGVSFLDQSQSEVEQNRGNLWLRLQLIGNRLV